MTLLPTPVVNDMGEGKEVAAWDEWTARMRDRDSNGNGHGASLPIEARRLAESHTGGANAHASEEGPSEDLRDVRSENVSPPLRCTSRGPNALPEPTLLFPTMRELAGDRHEGRVPLAGSQAPRSSLQHLWREGVATRAPRGPEPGEQRPGKSDDPVRVVSPETALAGGSGEAHGCHAWGATYGPAIHRWESTIGQVAPPPTEPSGTRGRRLSPRAVEFMMGLPAGYVTDPAHGLSRRDQLRALGNGVVPQQAAHAVTGLLNRAALEAVAEVSA